MREMYQLIKRGAGFALLMMTMVSAYAQQPGDIAGTRGEAALDRAGTPIMEIFKQGGWPMYLLAVMSIFGGALVLYFLVVMRVGLVVPKSLHKELLTRIGEGDLDEVRKACDYKPCPLSSVVLSAMDFMRRVPDADHATVKGVVEAEGVRYGQHVETQAQLLFDVATIAPMVGLLGTVLGMLEAFGADRLRDAVAKPMQVTSGVGQALVTTAFGLLVAIPAMICYAYFRRRAARQVEALESASDEVLTALYSKNNLI